MLAIATFDNFPAIACAYGRPAAEFVRRKLAERAADVVGASGAAYWAEDFLIVEVSCREVVTDRFDDASLAALLCSQLVDGLACDGIEFGDAVLFAVVTVVASSLAPDGKERADGNAAAVADALARRLGTARLQLASVSPDALSCARYRKHMAAVAFVAESIRERSLAIAWQPVRRGDGAVFYREAHVSFFDGDGTACSADALIPSLEAAGQVRALDAHVVGLVLDRLKIDPDIVLGCRISAQSAVADGWWEPVFERLRQDRNAASRLVIELAETAEFPNISLAVDFVDRLRRFGCQIAIGHFGAGHSSLRNGLALRPDIIKIDALYLTLAVNRAQQQGAAFAPLVKLARSMANEVAISGVDDPAAFGTASASEATLFQGRHLGMPGPIPTVIPLSATIADPRSEPPEAMASRVLLRLERLAYALVGVVLPLGAVLGALRS